MPTKLQEVSEIVAQLDEGQLVAEELKGIALMTLAAELKNLEAALDVSGTCVTPARLVEFVNINHTKDTINLN